MNVGKRVTLLVALVTVGGFGLLGNAVPAEAHHERFIVPLTAGVHAYHPDGVGQTVVDLVVATIPTGEIDTAWFMADLTGDTAAGWSVGWTCGQNVYPKVTGGGARIELWGPWVASTSNAPALFLSPINAPRSCVLELRTRASVSLLAGARHRFPDHLVGGPGGSPGPVPVTPSPLPTPTPAVTPTPTPAPTLAPGETATPAPSSPPPESPSPSPSSPPVTASPTGVATCDPNRYGPFATADPCFVAYGTPEPSETPELCFGPLPTDVLGPPEPSPCPTSSPAPTEGPSCGSGMPFTEDGTYSVDFLTGSSGQCTTYSLHGYTGLWSDAPHVTYSLTAYLPGAFGEYPTGYEFTSVMLDSAYHWTTSSGHVDGRQAVAEASGNGCSSDCARSLSGSEYLSGPDPLDFQGVVAASHYTWPWSGAERSDAAGVRFVGTITIVNSAGAGPLPSGSPVASSEPSSSPGASGAPQPSTQPGGAPGVPAPSPTCVPGPLTGECKPGWAYEPGPDCQRPGDINPISWLGYIGCLLTRVPTIIQNAIAFLVNLLIDLVIPGADLGARLQATFDNIRGRVPFGWMDQVLTDISTAVDAPATGVSWPAITVLGTTWDPGAAIAAVAPYTGPLRLIVLAVFAWYFLLGVRRRLFSSVGAGGGDAVTE